jgi:putative SbcD/Mre11-related phosphoesterase
MSKPKTKNEQILPIEIASGIQAVQLALYVPADDCMIFSDLQLGLEEHYSSQGMLVPQFNFKEIKKKLESIFEIKTKVSKIVLNGDTKHGFGKASNQEWREIMKLFELLSLHTKEIILIKGNHDIALEPIARFAKLKLEKEGLLLKNSHIYVCHGHEIPNNLNFQQAKTIVIGHDHPAIELKEGATKQKFKCFLAGKFEDKNLIVLPSFNFASIGSDPRKEALSPFLKQDLGNFNAWLIEDTVYNFGKLNDIER